jgi:GTP cyclohydrolase I
MSMRSVEKQNSVALTSAMLGVFQHEARTADGIPRAHQAP